MEKKRSIALPMITWFLYPPADVWWSGDRQLILRVAKFATDCILFIMQNYIKRTNQIGYVLDTLRNNSTYHRES